MSIEAPETREKNFYQQQREKLSAAIVVWREQPEIDSPSTPLGDAGDLEDCLHDQVLPRAAGAHGKYVVLVDSQPAPYPGQAQLTGPLDADEAAEVFLIESSKDDAIEKTIELRSATDLEMSAHAWDHITGGGL